MARRSDGDKPKNIPPPPSSGTAVDPVAPPPQDGAPWRPYRGAGHLPDEPDSRDRPVGGASLSRPIGGLKPPGSPTPDRLILSTAPIRDQLGTNECVAFTIARYINARTSYLTGREPPLCSWPSEHGIYGLARGDESKLNNGNFADDLGCFPRKAAAGILRHGLIDEKRIPFDPATVNDALPWDAVTAGYDAKVRGYHYLLPASVQGAEAFLDEMFRLFASGYTIPMATTLDAGFNNYDGAHPISVVSGTTRGSHYVLLTGYDKDRRVAFGDNSWGTAWGQSGRFEVSLSRLLSDDCFDFMLPTVIPDGRNIR